LTPRGFAEKSRLVGEYFAASFNFFRRAREQMSGLMAEAAGQGRKRIVFIGVSELAEVGALCAYDHPVELVAIVDVKHAGGRFCGVPVRKSLTECDAFDVAIVTDLTTPDITYRQASAAMPSERIMAPALLKRAIPKLETPRASKKAVE
jgi:hypothetical protein